MTLGIPDDSSESKDTSDDDMKQVIKIAECLKLVLIEMTHAVMRRSPDLPNIEPRLVCVTKTKSPSAVIEAYDAGQKHFGENYAAELHEKAHSEDIITQCKNIRWHFIGHMQMNNVKKVLSSPGLYVVETIHSEKLAIKINDQWPQHCTDENKILNVMVQVNTSGELSKNGVKPDGLLDLVKFIKEKCPNLIFRGLMTIGQYGYDCTSGPNPDFVALVKCREDLCAELKMNVVDMELSMGMSTDYAHAIELGSTNVRVGSSIFGSR